MRFTIRQEQPVDRPAIFEVLRRAFEQDAEAKLVENLRNGDYIRLSMVAELEGHVVGHILYSKLNIVRESETTAALALAPMAVLPEYQSLGIGVALVRGSLDICRQQGHQIVIVLGHPDYYARFGFSSRLALPLESPYAGDSFMALELVPDALQNVRGRVEYAPPFSEL